MPVLSAYWFDEVNFRGKVTCIHIPHKISLAQVSNGDHSGKRSTLVVERPDSEILFDLVDNLNTPVVLGLIDGMFPPKFQRTSSIRTGWRPYPYVEYYDKDPLRHADYDLLIRISFDFHANPADYCLAVDGEIVYYVFVYLDRSGHVQGDIDGWAFHTSEGSICRGGVQDKLNNGLPAGIPVLQNLLALALQNFQNQRFSAIYLLPGRGEKVGLAFADTNEVVTLALVPRVPLSILAGANVITGGTQ